MNQEVPVCFQEKKPESVFIGVGRLFMAIIFISLSS